MFSLKNATGKWQNHFWTPRKIATTAVFLLTILILIFAGVTLYRWRPGNGRSQAFVQWASSNAAARAELITAQREACPGAPFILPAAGFIGLLYADSCGPYNRSNPHQGIDIFTNAKPGASPVYAAYDGYLTCEESWRSSIILRVPSDPLRPGETI